MYTTYNIVTFVKAGILWVARRAKRSLISYVTIENILYLAVLHLLKEYKLVVAVSMGNFSAIPSIEDLHALLRTSFWRLPSFCGGWLKKTLVLEAVRAFMQVCFYQVPHRRNAERA
jgi:hypothetical protein